MPVKPKLTKREAELYRRVCAGKWYTAFSPKTEPKSMQRLVDLGLVSLCGRPKVFELCFVPTSPRIFKPFKPEQFKERL